MISRFPKFTKVYIPYRLAPGYYEGEYLCESQNDVSAILTDLGIQHIKYGTYTTILDNVHILGDNLRKQRLKEIRLERIKIYNAIHRR